MKLLIIEDDQMVANIYRNKFLVEGYQVEVAADGESGLKSLKSFRPDAVLLDLMLPTISGVEVIQQIRAEQGAKLPLIVFSNTYLSNKVQEAWKAGATKCLSKINCTPRQIIEVVSTAIASSGMSPIITLIDADTPAESAPEKPPKHEADTAFEAELRATFFGNLPATLGTLRTFLKAAIKADNEAGRLQQLGELHNRIRSLTGNAGTLGLLQIAQMSGALEALLHELHEKPDNINASTLRTVASAIDFLGVLFDHVKQPHRETRPPNILVVDDETISRRAITHALEKARLKCVNVEDPALAFKLLSEQSFDLVFLDVDMPGMTGFELCTKLRALPGHKQTPVVFVTGLKDLESRASSMMSGGNDFIAKPFLFMELAVKALVYVLRAKLHPVPRPVR
jgi:DNA-binding response OmpR family regulator